MQVPSQDLPAQFQAIEAEVRAAIDRVLASQKFILGAEGTALESELALHEGSAHAVATSSGTDALLASLMAAGVAPGDEVVTTPYTFIATGTAIARLGARPVFVDIDPVTLNLDPGRLEAALTPKTRAIVPVHLFGQMADTEAIQAVAAPRGIPIVEDAAQAIGAKRDGRPIGRGSLAATLSFFPSKNLGAMGDAGMVLTDDPAFADRLRRIRNHGQRDKHASELLGGNFRMDEIQAAILRAKLPHLGRWTDARRRAASRYRALFAEARIDPELLSLPAEKGGAFHVYNQLVVRSPRRDALRDHLTTHGVASAVYYPVPLPLQACFRDLGHAPGDFPESERAARETLALPIYPELEDQALRYVVDQVASFFTGGART